MAGWTISSTEPARGTRTESAGARSAWPTIRPRTVSIMRDTEKRLRLEMPLTLKPTRTSCMRLIEHVGNAILKRCELRTGLGMQRTLRLNIRDSVATRSATPGGPGIEGGIEGRKNGGKSTHRKYWSGSRILRPRSVPIAGEGLRLLTTSSLEARAGIMTERISRRAVIGATSERAA